MTTNTSKNLRPQFSQPLFSQALACSWQYPDDLPVSAAREEILKAIREHQILILCGATGSGKSTQLPKFCLEAGLGTKGQIAHTQPRRIAARALAERIASEIKEDVGQSVGWQVRFKSVVSAQTRVKLLTDGVLLSELRHDRLLRRYDALIIDEAHERSLNIDFLLGYIKRLAAQRPELKIIITSATLDAEKFSKHFEGALVIDVPGKSYPIDLRYRPPEELDINEAAARAVQEIWNKDAGDILIFLPGEREIREMAAYLGEYPGFKRLGVFDILPLFARLGSARQQKIFQPSGKRRLVLATNVAETSLTVPGIKHVIDTGTARISRYNPRTNVQNLLVENIAQANADQRKGRCGRTAPGICIRLYDENDFAQRPRYTDAEIQRTNLASVVLQMADLGLGEPEDFPFIDAPHRRYLNDARRLLNQLQAFKTDGRLSRTGRKLAHLPVDPRFGRILIAAAELGCLDEIVPIIAALSMQDPRERDFENRQRSDQAQQIFVDKNSDFITLLNLWIAAREQRQSGSNSEYRKWCQQHFLNVRRMQEWRDLVRQIRSESHSITAANPNEAHAASQQAVQKPQKNGSETSESSIDSNRIHLALLHGLLDHIAQHDVDGDYRAPRGARWRIHPESKLAKRQANWIVAAEVISTRRILARVIAHIQPEWIERAAAHLIQRQALDPQWNKARGEVMAREQVSLFGLILIADRQVPYARFDPVHARQIFIEQALLAGHWGKGPLPEFLAHNRKLMQALKDEENKLRKRDVLQSDDALIAWYDQRLPETVNSRVKLLSALADIPAQALHMSEADLRDNSALDLAHAYPGEMTISGLTLRLHYAFDPGSKDDGVSLDVPVASLNQIDADRLEWLVPGMLAQKIEALLKGLPKQIRRRFVPVSDSVRDCCAELAYAQGDLYSALARWLQRRSGTPGPSAAELRAIDLPDGLRIRIQIRDAKGGIVASDRHLGALQKRFAQSARTEFRALHDTRWEQRGMQAWDCPDLPETVEIQGNLQAFPCLQDQGKSVDLILRDNARDAQRCHSQGLLRLFLLVQQTRLKQLYKSLPQRQSIQLRMAALPNADEATRHLLQLLETQTAPGFAYDQDLFESLGARAVADVQLDPAIRSKAAFEQAVSSQTTALSEQVRRLWKAVNQVAEGWALWQNAPTAPKDSATRRDIDTQLIWLLSPGWIARTPDLGDLGRYLQALILRMQRAAHSPADDMQRMALITPHWQRCVDALAQCAKTKTLASDALVNYRWLIEEYRVSVFAQSLRTRQKVSEKRLNEAWLLVSKDH